MSRRRNSALSASLHPALRAADGAAYFSDEALEEANREGDAYKSRTALVLMDPADFLRMADPGKEEARQVALERVLREGTRLSDVPRLFVDYDETSGVAVVTGHEGRHRSRSLIARGVKQMPVRIHTTNIRWSEQTSPKAWDYIEVLPHTLTGEAGHAYNRMPMPVPIHYPQLAERMMKKNPAARAARPVRNPAKWFGHLVTDDQKVTISKEPIAEVQNTEALQKAAPKPRGLWYACGSEWIEWLESEMPHWLEEGQNLYDVRPRYSTVGVAEGYRGKRYVGGVLRITTDKEMEMFDLGFYVTDMQIDWPRVASIWDGIEICPYQYSFRDIYGWYYGWDVASGCIWRPSGADGLTLLHSRVARSTPPRKPRGFGSSRQRHTSMHGPRNNPSITLSHYATREEIKAASDRFFDALEARAGEKQTMYAGPFVVVGDRKGGVLGNLEVSVGGSSTLEAREPVVRLSFIGVSPDQRGEGRGTALLNLVTAAADDAGLAVELDVDPQTMRGEKKPPMNKAALRAFYKKAGFATVRGMGSDFMRRPVTKRNPRRMDGSVRPTRATQVNAYLAENGFPGVMLHRSARDAYCHFYGGDTDYWDDTSVYVPRISDLTLDAWLAEARRLAQTKRNPRRRNPARPARPARPKKFSNDPLTAQEKKDSGIANVYLMDWVCDGWGPLPPRIAEFEARRTPLTNAEKRELIDWYENNCHVNMF